MTHLKIVTLLTKIEIGLHISRSPCDEHVSFGKLKKNNNYIRRYSNPILQCRVSGKSVQLGTELFPAVGHRDGQ
jgi:hypothetical protein